MNTSCTAGAVAGSAGDAAAFDDNDKAAMRRALALAKEAADDGEVPVGAVVYCQNKIVGEGRNQTISQCNPVAHAEIVALQLAAKCCGNFRLPGFKMAVTLEPCPMCAGAVFLARLDAVVFGAQDPKTGALGGVTALHLQPQFNHQTAVAGGLFADEAATLLREFFRTRR